MKKSNSDKEMTEIRNFNEKISKQLGVTSHQNRTKIG